MKERYEAAEVIVIKLDTNINTIILDLSMDDFSSNVVLPDT